MELANKLKKTASENEYLKIENSKLQQELYITSTHKL